MLGEARLFMMVWVLWWLTWWVVLDWKGWKWCIIGHILSFVPEGSRSCGLYVLRTKVRNFSSILGVLQRLSVCRDPVCKVFRLCRECGCCILQHSAVEEAGSMKCLVQKHKSRRRKTCSVLAAKISSSFSWMAPVIIPYMYQLVCTCVCVCACSAVTTGFLWISKG